MGDGSMSELIRRFETATKLASAAMEPLTKIVTMDAQAILNLLREQEDEIRQLRLALDIAKGECKGIAVGGR